MIAEQNTERFLNSFERLTPSECWAWTGEHDDNGRPLFTSKGRISFANRVAYFAYRGSVPTDKQVVQTCNSVNCVNPHHMKLVDK